MRIENKVLLKEKSDVCKEISKLTYTKSIPIMFILISLLIVISIISFTIGRYAVPIPQLLHIIIGKILGVKQDWPSAVEMVIFNIRIPRIVMAIFVGGALSASGATYQGLFRNPMVSPDILGASAGAGFGAAMAILMSFNTIEIQICSFISGLLAVALTFMISNFIVSKDNKSILSLVLSGIVVAALFSAFISLTKYLADPDSKLPEITFWLMGSLSRAFTFRDIFIFSIILCIGLIPIIALRWNLNILSFGDEEAKAMGVNTNKIRLIFILCSTLLTAAAVSVSGIVGWVGLIIPHISRILVGPNYKKLLPASIIIGSIFLLLVDDVSRGLFSVEIPLGILTAIIGAPFFVYLLSIGKNNW